MEIDTSYGYPLLKHFDEHGNITWFFPKTPADWDKSEPRLIPGFPSANFKDGYKICLFVDRDNPVPPRVLSVSTAPF